MTNQRPQAPGEPPRRPTVAESLQASRDRLEARKQRTGLLALLYATVIVGLVLIAVVRVNLDAPPPARAAGAPRAAPAPATDPAAAGERTTERVFEAMFARLQQESAADAGARERTQTQRSQLARTIERAGIDLRIERFECARHVCLVTLLGDAKAYRRLRATLPASPQAPFGDMAGSADAPQSSGRHRFILAIDPAADAASAPAATTAPAARP